MRPSLAQHEYWVCFVSRTKDAQSHHQQENLTQCSDESSEWLPRTIEQKHKFHLAGDMAFGEDADIFQAFGIMGMVASGIPLFGLGVDRVAHLAEMRGCVQVCAPIIASLLEFSARVWPKPPDRGGR